MHSKKANFLQGTEFCEGTNSVDEKMQIFPDILSDPLISSVRNSDINMNLSEREQRKGKRVKQLQNFEHVMLARTYMYTPPSIRHGVPTTAVTENN
jgi:nitrate reductase cytochrome c-type subunit